MREARRERAGVQLRRGDRAQLVEEQPGGAHREREARQGPAERPYALHTAVIGARAPALNPCCGSAQEGRDVEILVGDLERRALALVHADVAVAAARPGLLAG